MLEYLLFDIQGSCRRDGYRSNRRQDGLVGRHVALMRLVFFARILEEIWRLRTTLRVDAPTHAFQVCAVVMHSGVEQECDIKKVIAVIRGLRAIASALWGVFVILCVYPCILPASVFATL